MNVRCVAVWVVCVGVWRSDMLLMVGRIGGGGGKGVTRDVWCCGMLVHSVVAVVVADGDVW